MAPGDPESYLEQCLAALPPEKREAARRAFAEISETGDDSYLSKLLAVLEANGAYAKKIPKDMAEAGGKLLRDLTGLADKLAAQQSQDEGRREASFKKLLAEQSRELTKALSLNEVASGIEKQSRLLEQLNRSASQPEEEHWAGVVFLMTVACLAGAVLTVWLFWDDYRDAREAKALVDRAAGAGIRIQVEKADSGERLTVTGPAATAGFWKKDDGATINGAVLYFAAPK
jgi:hypothetical protein